MTQDPKNQRNDATGAAAGPSALSPGAARATSAPLQAGRSLWSDARRRLMRDRSAMLCLAVIVLYTLLAIGAALYEFIAARKHSANWPTLMEMVDYQHVNQPPSFDHGWKNLLGTDWSGKSVLIKTILGAKVSLTVGLMANVIAVPLGMLLGALAGFYGRFLDDAVVWFYSTLASIPSFILLVAMKYAFRGQTILGLDLTGIHGIYIALGVTSWIGTCRLIRAEVMKLRELDYVMASRATGRGGLAILVRHILPNVFHIGIINFSLGFVGAIAAEVGLSYLGLGVAVGTASWGEMINGARAGLYAGQWWELTSAVGAMFFLVLALNIFGDRLRDALDPRLKNI